MEGRTLAYVSSSEAVRAAPAHRVGVPRSRPHALLACADALIAAAVATIIGPAGLTDGLAPAAGLLAWELVAAAAAPIALLLAGGYSPRPMLAPRLAIAGMGCMAAAGATAEGAGARIGIAEALACGIAAAALWGAARATLRRSSAEPERVLIVGGGQVAQRLVELFRRHPEHGLVAVGYVDRGPSPLDPGVPRAGRIDDLPALLAAGAADRVFVAFADGRDAETLSILRACDSLGVEVDIVSRFFELVGHDVHAYALGGMPVVSVAGAGTGLWEQALKRAADIAGALALLVALAPVLAAVALAIALEDGRPILFRQERVGREGRPFRILKFRTMRRGADRATLAESVHLRERVGIGGAVFELKRNREADVTRVGRRLRRASLDELPQLLNVLAGDMSLIGPRPIRDFEAAELTDWQRSRMRVRPGMSGLWQVLGRSDIGWDERMQLDYSYVRHWSLRSDFGIAARTVPAMIRGRGAR